MIVQNNEIDCRNIYERAIFVTTTIYLGITGLSVRTPRYKNVSENRSDYKSNRAPRRECFLHLLLLLLLILLLILLLLLLRVRPELQVGYVPLHHHGWHFFLFVFYFTFYARGRLFIPELPTYIFFVVRRYFILLYTAAAAAAAGEVVVDDANPVRLYEKII
jgi:hypothetical protein